MSDDISPILRRWPWNPNRTVRRIVGDDGRQRVQIRVCMHGYHGVLQFDCDGRPDGCRPHGFDFTLDHYEQRARSAPAFRLTKRQAKELFDEGTMVYQRYVVLFQMGDYERVVRDTERNMRLFRFVNRCARREEDRRHLERWWPYIIRIHATAKAMLCLAAGDAKGAARCVRDALSQIKALDDMDDETFASERNRSTDMLTDLGRQIDEQRPLSEIEVLERMKERAINQENYELAARLRDQINELRNRNGASDARAGPDDPFSTAGN